RPIDFPGRDGAPILEKPGFPAHNAAVRFAGPPGPRTRRPNSPKPLRGAEGLVAPWEYHRGEKAKRAAPGTDSGWPIAARRNQENFARRVSPMPDPEFFEAIPIAPSSVSGRRGEWWRRTSGHLVDAKTFSRRGLEPSSVGLRPRLIGPRPSSVP